jgi:hypothetical protein
MDMHIFSDKRDDEMKSSEADNTAKTRDHLKRRAKEMKNSKYDEAYLVNYSGSRPKFLKHSDLGVKAQTSSSKDIQQFCQKSGSTTTGKLSSAIPQKRI